MIVTIPAKGKNRLVIRKRVIKISNGNETISICYENSSAIKRVFFLNIFSQQQCFPRLFQGSEVASITMTIFFIALTRQEDWAWLEINNALILKLFEMVLRGRFSIANPKLFFFFYKMFESMILISASLVFLPWIVILHFANNFAFYFQ
jgi:hypothetical protein